MDLNKLKADLDSKRFVDVKIRLVDDTKIIILFVHKIILAISSIYFYRLFTFPGNNKNTYTLEVDDADIANDIIMSFYGKTTNFNYRYSNWEYLLKMFKNRSFFCLENDFIQLYNLEVPSYGFNLLLEVIENFDYVHNPKLVLLIKNNMPMDYDLTKLTIDFVRLLLDTKNSIIISCDNNNTIKIYNMKNQYMQRLNGFNCHMSVAISNDIFIITASSGFDIKIWNVNEKYCIHILKGHTGWVHTIATSLEKNLIVSGSWDKTVKIWDIITGKCLNTLYGHEHWVNSVAISSDSYKIISGSSDWTIRIWDVKTGKCLNILRGHSGSVESVFFSNDNSLIISGSNDYSVKIWNTNTGQIVSTLIGHINTVNSVVITNDNSKIVSCSDDKTIKIWNINTGDCLQTITGDVGIIHSVAFGTIQTEIDKKLRNYLINK